MISVFVPGTPIAQGSMTAFVVGQRAVITDQRRKQLKPWRDAIGAAVAATGEQFGTAAVAVRVDFVIGRPKTVKRPLPSVAAPNLKNGTSADQVPSLATRTEA